MLAVLALFACHDGEDHETETTTPPTEEGLLTDGGLYRMILSQDPDPAVSGPTVITLGLHEAARGSPVTGARVDVVPWMPDHGHGIHGEPEVEERGGGGYEISFSYTMPGTWELSWTVEAEPGVDTLVQVVEVQ